MCEWIYMPSNTTETFLEAHVERLEAHTQTLIKKLVFHKLQSSDCGHPGTSGIRSDYVVLRGRSSRNRIKQSYSSNVLDFQEGASSHASTCTHARIRMPSCTLVYMYASPCMCEALGARAIGDC